MKKTRIVAFGLLALLLGGCGSASNLNPSTFLVGKSWVLSSLMGQAPDLEKFAAGVPTLSFLEEGRLAGFAGCNNFSGSFELGSEPDAITLEPGAMTRKACPDNGEDEFLAAFKQAKNFKLQKEKLTLMDGAIELMSFSPVK